MDFFPTSVFREKEHRSDCAGWPLAAMKRQKPKTVLRRQNSVETVCARDALVTATTIMPLPEYIQRELTMR